MYLSLAQRLGAVHGPVTFPMGVVISVSRTEYLWQAAASSASLARCHRIAISQWVYWALPAHLPFGSHYSSSSSSSSSSGC